MRGSVCLGTQRIGMNPPESGTDLLSGLIVRAQSGFLTVETERGLVVAQLRGRHKRGPRETDLVAVGDRVKVRVVEDGSGVIEEVAERERVLSRRAPGSEWEQVIVANPDQAVFVFACAEPAPRYGLLDRLLVVAEEQDIPAAICANKTDLVSRGQARESFGPYQSVGYPVYYTSALSGRGVEKLRRALEGKLSVFAGPSGVGKSMLLNAIQPDLGLRIGEVSQATGKGVHTTVVRQVVRLEGGGYVVDTPGVKAFALWDIEPEELDGYFREIAPLVEQCAFSDCTHEHEPDCAVIAAVESGEIHPRRYESYLRMVQGDLD